MKTRSALIKRRWWSLMLFLSLVLAGSIRAATAQDADNTAYLPVVVGSTTTGQQEVDATPASDTVTQSLAIPDPEASPSTVQSAEASIPSFDRIGNFSLSGNLGVGTDTPAEAITINAGPARFRINDFRNFPNGDPAFTFFTRGTQVGALFFQDALNNQLVLRAGPNGAGGTNNIILQQPTANTTNTPLFIASNGNVGIGAAPASEYPLHVIANGSAVVLLQSKISGSALHLRTPDGVANQVELVNQVGGRFSVIVAAGFEAISVLRSGKVGIGTLAPNAQLEVNGNLITSASSSEDGSIYMAGTDFVMRPHPTHGSGGRALVHDVGNKLQINYANEFAGVQINGQVGIGTSSPNADLTVSGSASKPGGGPWSTFSDERIKKNVTAFADGVDVLMAINPVRFEYNGLGGYEDDGKEYIGVLAQEVEQVAPYMISTFATTDFADQRVFDGSALTYILVNAVQEQQTQIETLQSENTELRSKLTELEQLHNEVVELKALVEQLAQK